MTSPPLEQFRDETEREAWVRFACAAVVAFGRSPMHGGAYTGEAAENADEMLRLLRERLPIDELRATRGETEEVEYGGGKPVDFLPVPPPAESEQVIYVDMRDPEDPLAWSQREIDAGAMPIPEQVDSLVPFVRKSELDTVCAKLAEAERRLTDETELRCDEADVRCRAESERDTWEERSGRFEHLYKQLAAKQDTYGAKLRRRIAGLEAQIVDASLPAGSTRARVPEPEPMPEPLTPAPSAVQEGAGSREEDVEAARAWINRYGDMLSVDLSSEEGPGVALAAYATHVTAELRLELAYSQEIVQKWAGRIPKAVFDDVCDQRDEALAELAALKAKGGAEPVGYSVAYKQGGLSARFSGISGARSCARDSGGTAVALIPLPAEPAETEEKP